MYFTGDKSSPKFDYTRVKGFFAGQFSVKLEDGDISPIRRCFCLYTCSITEDVIHYKFMPTNTI